MARLIGPAQAERVFYYTSGPRKGQVVPNGTAVPLYADPQCSLPADVLALDGGSLPVEGVIPQVLISDTLEVARFQFPDVDDPVVYTRVVGGPVVALHPDPDSRLDAFQAVLDDAVASVAGKADVPPKLDYLDAYNSFFGGVGWVNTQGNTATTLAAAAAAGATTVQVASATGILTGVLLVIGAGTAQQQLVTVTNVAGTTLTVSPALAGAWPSGQSIAPVWTNSSHITFDSVGGARAFAYWIANYRRADGTYVITGTDPKVVWLGDSWTAECIPELTAELKARLGSATTVINAGVPGDTLAKMIARFTTDVAPQSPEYVVLEYGVNDVYQGVTSSTMAAQLEQAVALCRSVGANVVIPGIPPLTDFPVQSRDRNLELRGQTAGPSFPALTAAGVGDRLVPVPRNTTSLRIGDGAQPVATGVRNTAVGVTAQQVLTTGLSNTAVGADTQKALTTGNANTAVGDQAQKAIVGTAYNTAIGQSAQLNLISGSQNTSVGGVSHLSLTTGSLNVAVGYRAGYAPAGVIANATTTASGQTTIGTDSGQSSATQSANITAVGYQAVAGGTSSTSLGALAAASGFNSTALGGSSVASGLHSTAVGMGATASGDGSVAIGRDNAGTGASATGVNDLVLGTALHVVQVPGTLRLPAGTATKAPLRIAPGVAPTSPVDGDMWTTSAGLFVRINGATVGPLS